MIRGRLIAAAVAVLVATAPIVLPSHAGAAAPQEYTGGCGGTITDDRYLASDLTGCAGWITIIGGSLDMRGHTLTGDGSANGVCIILQGAAVLRDGTISTCRTGVLANFDGGGHNIVSGMTITDTPNTAILLDSEDNIVRDSTIKRVDIGVVIFQDGNFIAHNTVQDASHHGFQIYLASSNVLWSNTATRSAGIGFKLFGGGTGNVLVKNTASQSGTNGFDVRLDSNILLLNKATGSHGDGFATDHDGNLFGGNVAKDNDVGIALETGADANKVLGNATADNKTDDLSGTAATCATNTWEDNKGKKVTDPCEREVQITDPAPILPPCGVTLAAASYKLVGDLSCDTQPALRLNGAKLDMAGHTISGNDANTCVQLNNLALLANGKVKSCAVGVETDAAAPSGSIVRNVVAKPTLGTAFRLLSPSSIAHDNSAVATDVEAFRVGSSSDFVFDNVVPNGFGLGYDVIGTSDRLWSNVGNKTDAGFVLASSATGDVLAGNKASGNVGDGYEINNDNGLLLVNAASNNINFGFELTAAPEADGNLVGGNKSIENRNGGIFADGTGNQLIGNKAKKNKPLDLEDGNDNCTNNLWEGNVFSTSDPSCIT